MKDFEVFHRDEKTATVTIGSNTVHVVRHVLHPVKQIFPKDELTRYEFGEILRLRCWDEKRDNIDKYLTKLGVPDYDVYKICEKTHGVRKSDYIWFRFQGENLTFEDLFDERNISV